MSPYEYVRSSAARVPAVAGVLVFIAGIYFASGIRVQVSSGSFVPLVLYGLIVPVTWSAYRRGSRPMVIVSTGALLFCVGFGTTMAAFSPDENMPRLPGKRSIQAVVHKTQASGPGYRVILFSSGIDSETGRVLPGYGRVYVRRNTLRLCAGDRLAFRSYIRIPENRNNPGELDWEMYCLAENIRWLGSVSGSNSLTLIRRGGRFSPAGLIFRARDSLRRFLDAHASGEVRAVLKSITIGDRGELSHELRESFSDAGLAHVLSASGLHVGIAAALAYQLVAALARARPRVLFLQPFMKIVACVSVPIIIAYCSIVGARAPAIRAGVMGLVVAFAVIADRDWRSLNSLALAALVVLALQPLSVFTLGFQLSFLAVFGILLVVPKVSDRLLRRGTGTVGVPGEADPSPAAVLDRFPLLRRVVGSAVLLVFVTVSAQVAVAPLLLLVFHRLPMYGLAANMVGSLLLLIALPTALIASVTGLFAPGVGHVLLVPAKLSARALIDTASVLAELPASTVTLPYFNGVCFGACLIFSLCFLFLLRRPSARRGIIVLVSAASAIVTVTLVTTLSSTGVITAVFLNVGKADACFVRPPGTRGILIDGGLKNDYFDAGHSIVAPFLKWRGITGLDAVIISHPQADHIGGLQAAMEQAPPGLVLLNRIPYRTDLLTAVLTDAARRGAELKQADRTMEELTFGEARLQFLNRPVTETVAPLNGRDVNNASTVFKLRYGNVSFLFTGDLEADGEHELVTSGKNLQADVLKVAHHGCESSSTTAFLEAVRPKICVISCDDSPLGRCPGQEVTARLKALGCVILWTGRDGAVTVETDGTDIRYKTGAGSWRRAHRPTIPRHEEAVTP